MDSNLNFIQRLLSYMQKNNMKMPLKSNFRYVNKWTVYILTDILL